MNNFSILVNTTDSFEDCWEPFFKLFKKFWPEYKGKIYLNTETKSYNYSGLDIFPIKNSLVDQSWSKCLKYALNTIEDEIILYLQDDYFLNNYVNSKIINQLIEKMKNSIINCIHLHPCASAGPFESSEFIDLLKFSKKAAYKIGTQASLWKKDFMKKYIRDHEDAWHFEIYGTRRAWRHNEEIYIYNYQNNKNKIIPYNATGIVKGKWKKEFVVDLFEENEIFIDFDNRGFYNPFNNKLKTPLTIGKILNRIKSIY